MGGALLGESPTKTTTIATTTASNQLVTSSSQSSSVFVRVGRNNASAYSKSTSLFEVFRESNQGLGYGRVLLVIPGEQPQKS